MALVITTCTNRKRKPIPRALCISDLAAAPLASLAASWCDRLATPLERYPASTIYGGRAFQEAASAADGLGARLLVVSAGLGLIDAASQIPPYACTVLLGTEDSVAGRVAGSFSTSTWWRALRAGSPFSVTLQDLVDEEGGEILAALSDSYLTMVGDELASLPPACLANLRIFTRAPECRIAPALQPFVMPYDDRLDGPDSPVRGTRNDFAARALRHYTTLPRGAGLAAAAQAVREASADWRFPAKLERARLTDPELKVAMREHWDTVGGSSSRLLRFFRDELGIACEQARFAELARQVRGEIA